METSIFLARVIGLYFVILSLFMLIRHKTLIKLVKEFTSNRSVTFLTAIITLILGILLVVSHNIWVEDWRVIITLISWLIFISGIIRIFWFDSAKSIAGWWLKRQELLRGMAVIYLAIGIYLLCASMGL